MRRSTDRYGADVGETGSGEPGERRALRARSNDVDLIHELPYGPAACEPPQQRPDTWQHPIQRRSCSKILLAPEGASTQGVSKRLFQGLLAAFARETGAGRRRTLVLDRAGWHTEPGLAVPSQCPGVRHSFPLRIIWVRLRPQAGNKKHPDDPLCRGRERERQLGLLQEQGRRQARSEPR